MKILTIVRCVGALIAAIVTTLVLLIAVELFSSIVHPVPADFDGSMEQMCQHVAEYPHWVLAVVVPMWGFIAFLGTWLAGRLGNRGCAIFMAILLLAAVLWNIAMLPYPLWFKIVQPVAVLIALFYGLTIANRVPPAKISTEATLSSNPS